MKNPNGFGTVRKLSGKRRRPFAALTPAHEVPGEIEKKRITIGYYAKRSEALLALADWHKHPTFTAIPAEEMKLEQLYSEFIKTQRYKNISKSTQDNYNAAWKYLNELGQFRVKDLRTAQYQAVIDRAAEQGRSLSTLQKIKIFAGLLCDYAVQNDIVNKNYAQFIVLPRMEKTEKIPFNELELKKIEQAAAEGFMYADLIYLLCLTGWRINEFLSLTRFSYDPTENTLTGGLKTESGKNRVVPVSDKALPYLLKWLDKGGEYIICRDQGGKLVKVTDKYFRNEWYYPTLEALGLPRLTPHATRHTFASILHKSGVDSWDIQRLMGHASPDVTNKVYTHIDIEQLKNAVGQI